MKAYTYIKKGVFALTDKPKPTILEPTDAIVRTTLSSICSSDLHIKHGSVPRAVLGITLGHEMVGIVEEIGPEVKNARAAGHAGTKPHPRRCFRRAGAFRGRRSGNGLLGGTHQRHFGRRHSAHHRSRSNWHLHITLCYAEAPEAHYRLRTVGRAPRLCAATLSRCSSHEA